MKKEKVTKEITLTGNTAIKFGNPNATNGDMLIMGNFKNICGEVNWNGLNMTEPQIPNKDDVRKGDYSIKILCKKDNKGKCTPIKTIYITLR